MALRPRRGSRAPCSRARRARSLRPGRGRAGRSAGCASAGSPATLGPRTRSTPGIVHGGSVRCWLTCQPPPRPGSWSSSRAPDRARVGARSPTGSRAGSGSRWVRRRLCRPRRLALPFLDEPKHQRFGDPRSSTRRTGARRSMLPTPLFFVMAEYNHHFTAPLEERSGLPPTASGPTRPLGFRQLRRSRRRHPRRPGDQTGVHRAAHGPTLRRGARSRGSRSRSMNTEPSRRQTRSMRART